MLILNNSFREPNLIGEYQALQLLNNLDYGFVTNAINTISGYTINDLYNHYNTHMKNIKASTSVINNNIKFNDDFIEYAQLKCNVNK